MIYTSITTYSQTAKLNKAVPVQNSLDPTQWHKKYYSTVDEKDRLCLAHLPKGTGLLRLHCLPNTAPIDLKLSISTKYDTQRINKFQFLTVSWKQVVKAVKKHPVQALAESKAIKFSKTQM